MTEAPTALFQRIPLDRVSVLIDSIYAFAMTLLVLTIDIPSKYDNSKVIAPVHPILISVLPDILHYFIAFGLLAILWYFEHQRFRVLEYLNRPLLCMNIASLMFVCLLPFSTNIAGDYPFDTLGAIIFEVNIFVIGMIACTQWIYIWWKKCELVPDLGEPQIHRQIIWSLIFPVLSLAGIAIAMAHVPWSVLIYTLAPLIMAFLFRRAPC
jgi:uncharacterized membrane protein